MKTLRRLIQKIRNSVAFEAAILYIHDLEKIDDCKHECVEMDIEMLKHQFPKNREWFDFKKIMTLHWALTKAGNSIVGAFDGDRLASYGLIDYTNLNRLNIPLKETDAYLWDEYTHPDYRRQGYHRDIVMKRLAMCKARGKRRVLTYVESSNKPSVIAHEREGFVRQQSFVILRVWRFRYCSFKYPS